MLIFLLPVQVGHRDFDVEKKLRRDLKRTHALLADAQLLLSTVDSQRQELPGGTREQVERLHCQVTLGFFRDSLSARCFQGAIFIHALFPRC